MTRDISNQSVAAAARALRSGDLMSVALTEASLDRIAEFDGRVNAFVHVDAEGALRQARHADDLFRAGIDLGPMQGVPYALKDIYDAAGMATTCHSQLKLDHIAESDSAVAERFGAAGAVLIGKLATFEFALGGPSFDLPFPPSRNPWDLRRTAGGSSSGSGAAIAAGFVPVAAGTCTTGSIRGPAAWCGAVGLKPTFGRVSRRGVFPLAQSLDHCGMLTRTVHDSAVTLGIVAGHDPADPASADAPVADYVADLDAGVAGLRVGLPLHLFEASPLLTADARRGIDAAVDWLRDRGAIVEAVTIPDYALFVACGRVLMTAEAFAIHRPDLRERLEQYGAITARRFSVGASIGAADYIAARRLRRTLAAAVDEVLGGCDMLLTAISLAPAPFLTQDTAPTVWPLQASTFNVSGHPAISVPVGLDSDGLPLAVQLVGRRFDEATILRGARVIEQASGWDRMPLPDLSIAAPDTRAIRKDDFR
ncbi:MAG: amidase [Hyphomicrobiales bacterium]|nr:MAG: amidase [Hyphomicrobiales bacterium]